VYDVGMPATKDWRTHPRPVRTVVRHWFIGRYGKDKSAGE
jgi:hypothetical protein